MNIPEEMIKELHREVQKVCPITGVASDGSIRFAPEATPAQQTAAQSVVANFDTSPAGQAARETARRRLPEPVEAIRDALNADATLTNAQISRLLKFMLNRLLPR